VSEFHYVRTPGEDGGVDACEGPAIGLDLETVLKDGLPPWKIALEIIAALCEILDIADQDGEIHGDVGPPVVFIDETGAVSLEGFGVPRKRTRAPEGTAKDTRADLYCLGATALRTVTRATVPERLPDDAAAHDDAIIDLALAIDLSELDEAMQGDVQWFLAKLMAFDREDRPAAVDAWRTFVAFAAAMPGPDMAEWCAQALDGGGERRSEARRVPGSAPPPPPSPGDEDLSGPAVQKGFLTGRPVNFDDGGAAKGGATAFWTKEDMKRALEAQKHEVTEEGPPAGVGGGSATNFWSKEQLAQMERGDASAPRPQRAEGVGERRKVTAAQAPAPRGRSAPGESNPSTAPPLAPPPQAPRAPAPPPPRATPPAAPQGPPQAAVADDPETQPQAPPPGPPPPRPPPSPPQRPPEPAPTLPSAEPTVVGSLPRPGEAETREASPPRPGKAPTPVPAGRAQAPEAFAQQEEEKGGGWFVVLFGGSVLAFGAFVALVLVVLILVALVFASMSGGPSGSTTTPPPVPSPPPSQPVPLPPPDPVDAEPGTPPEPRPDTPTPSPGVTPDPAPTRPRPGDPAPAKPPPAKPPPAKPPPVQPAKPPPAKPPPAKPPPAKPPPAKPPPVPAGGEVSVQLRSSGRGTIRNCTDSSTQFDGLRNFKVAGYKLPAACLVEIEGAKAVFTVNGSGDITCNKQGTVVVCDKSTVP
jgi:hypothetical protein